MATSLGLVGIVSKGEYSASVTYIKGNFVYHNNSTWLCIAETITGSEPSESNSNWQLLAKGVQLVVFTGATATTDGTMGAVPQPLAGDEGKFLKGSGGWANVPDPQVFTGATASADGTSGLIPVPHAGDENKFIRGDGSWASAAADDNFVGTLAQWNALSLAEQIKYKTADITDDFNGSPVDDALSDTSSNPVQNRIITEKINILIQNGNWRTGFRNKNLGTSFTADQKAMIAAGDFTELWNGDYWVINGVTWRIVDNSQFQKRKGDTEFNKNHLIIMPDSNLIAAEAFLIDDANSSTHGYANCAYRTRTDAKGRTQCKTLFSNAFGADHIASHREMMSTSRGAGGALDWGWQDADVELPSEVNLYGHSAWGCGLNNAAYSSGYNIGAQWGQFKLFELEPVYAFLRQNSWLRDLVSASFFARVDRDGSANLYTPSAPWFGLRPYAILV